MNMHYKSREDSLQEFHSAFGHPVDEVMTVDGMELRRSLIVEEFTELMSEISHVSIALARGRKPKLEVKENLLKELCDLQYVISFLVNGAVISKILGCRNIYNSKHIYG